MTIVYINHIECVMVIVIKSLFILELTLTIKFLNLHELSIYEQ